MPLAGPNKQIRRFSLWALGNCDKSTHHFQINQWINPQELPSYAFFSFFFF